MTSKTLCAFVLLPLFACGSISGAPQRLEVVRHNELQINVSLTIGQSLTVHTSPEPITAYRWGTDLQPGSVIQQINPLHFESKGAAPLPGKPQTTRFDFLATSTGNIDVHFLKFAGPKYPGYDVVDRFVLHVTVT